MGFLQARCACCHPTNSLKALKGGISHLLVAVISETTNCTTKMHHFIVHEKHS